MRVKILSPRVTFGEVGQVVEVPEGVNVEALIAGKKVEESKPKKATDSEPDEAA